MAHQVFSFKEEQFSKLFPFYLRVNDRLEIVAMGSTLQKMQLAPPGSLFANAFAIKRPETLVSDFASLKQACNQMLVIQSLGKKEMVLRGQMEWLPDTNEILFVGTPWFGSMDQVTGSGLNIHDFALHDPMIDLLHVLKTQEITNEDLKQLLTTVNKQKKELQQAKKQLEEMALFPMQNPDALVRIGNDGKVLLMNPSAVQLSDFLFNGITYTVDEFWKMIAEKVRPDADVWQFEAVAGGRAYSFLCKNITGAGYFNVYGRDVTEKQAAEKNLLISEQNFRVMGENIPGLIYLWRLNYDGTSRFEYMSPRMEAELGIPMHDLEKITSYIHPDDLEDWGNRLQDAFVHNTPFEYNGRLLLPDGTTVWLQCASRVAYEDEHGKVFSGYFRNVTEERKKNIHFELLSYAASSSESAVKFFNSNRQIIWANKKSEELFGYSTDELAGKRAKEFYGPESDPDTLAYIESAIRDKANYNAEVILYRKTGEPFWARIEGLYVELESPKDWVRIATITDITGEKKRSEETKRISMVASANENGVVFTTADGHITWTNKAFADMVGYSAEEIIGKTPVEMFRGPLTDTDTLHYIVNSFSQGLGFQSEVIFYRKDGSWFWGRCSIQPIKSNNGRITEYFGIIEDVTRQKAQEERLKVLSKIAEENINPVIIADAKGQITWVNKSFTKLTGYSFEEVHGQKPGRMLQGKDTNPETVEYLRKQITTGQSFSTEILNYSKNGKPYWLRIAGQPIYDEKNQLTGFFAIEEDITREKEINQRIQESENRLRVALEKIGDNVWEHDFKTSKTFFSKEENEFIGTLAGSDLTNAVRWWNAIHPDDRPKLTRQDEDYKKGLIDSHGTEYRMIGNDGTVRWVLDRGVVIEKDDKGLPLRIIGTHTDITSIKQIEQELAQRVQQFKTLAESIPGVIYEYEFRKDGNEGLRYMSPTVKEIFGLQQTDFEHFETIVHPDDIQRIKEKNKMSQETHVPFYDESRLVYPDGRIVWRSVSSSFSYYTSDGSAVFTGFMLDITARKMAEQELNEQRRFYEDILNNMPADIAVFNPNHEYLFVNPNGIKDESLRKWIIGKRDEDYCAYRNKPQGIAEERRAIFNKVIATKMPEEREEKIEAPGGQPVYLLRRWFPVLDTQGNPTLVIGYGVDITRRKLAEEALRANEEKYRSIIANMNLGLTEMTEEGVITFVNRTLASMAGLKQEDLVGGDAFQFVPAASRQLILERLKRRKEGISEAYEFKPVLRNNREVWWLQSAAPKYDGNGDFVGSIVVSLDITKQKKLQHDLEEARAQAEQLAKAKETFLANMSHEIRTPMNAIMGLSRQLKKTSLNDQQRFYLESILTASDNLLVIINDILDLSKIEAGKLALEHIGFSPKDLLAGVSRMLMHRAEEKGLWMQAEIDVAVGPVVIGDPFRINQVLLNLAGNAIKFTQGGGVTLGLKLIHERDGHQLLRFSVADTGIGISEEFRAKMFEAFAQEYRSTSRNYGGTGLGLAISRQLLDLMNSQLQVDSEKGKGSVFSFELSLPKGTNADLKESVETGLEQNVLQGKHILLVEDNSMNRLVASTSLVQFGARVTEAENGQIAVDMLLKNSDPVDLVLMDMQMPVMDGITATQRIRAELSADLPVIALSANALASEKEQCLKVGMNDFITKPFEEHAFIQTITRWLGLESPLKKALGDESASGQRNGEGEATEGEETRATAGQLYSLKTLEGISRGNQEFVRKMVLMFCEQAPALTQEMKQALDDENLEKMGALAHKLKPTIDSMEMEGLKEVIRLVEKAGKTGERPMELVQWVALSIQQITDAANELKTIYHQ